MPELTLDVTNASMTQRQHDVIDEIDQLLIDLAMAWFRSIVNRVILPPHPTDSYFCYNRGHLT